MSHKRGPTFRDLLAFVDLGGFFFKEGVSLFAELEEVRAGDTCLFDFCEDFLAYIGSCFEFCESIGIGEGVVLTCALEAFFR